MDMQLSSSRVPSVFSVSVIVALFLCQVIGSFCMMPPPPAESTTTIHGVYASHPMGEGMTCQDSVPSSFKSVLGFDESAHLVMKLFSADLTQADSLTSAVGIALPADSNPPLYTRLSTFRI